MVDLAMHLFAKIVCNNADFDVDYTVYSTIAL